MTAVELVQASAPVTLVVIYAMLGWVAEVVFFAVTEGEVTYREFLAGPYCPIYGFGALAMTARATMTTQGFSQSRKRLISGCSTSISRTPTMPHINENWRQM